MVSRFSNCDDALVQSVLIGDADAELVSRLEQHIDTCPRCRHRLEELAGGQPWSTEVQQFLSSSDVSIVCETDDHDDSQHAVESLVIERFLEPTSDASKLGKLGPYEVVRVIGRGGFGVVLQAFEPALQRHVAIKVLAAHLASSAAARRRFAREAQAAAAVVHDHVIPIYAVDADRELPFLVMPLINGKSLQDRIDEAAPLEAREILRISRQAALGLAAAHAQGLIHLDVKPGNILLENGVERVRITDFGLARTADDASQTQSGIVAGTPQYMSPEQARGEVVDFRTDLFSLGSVMYAMCTGHPPFRAENALAVLRRICDDDYRPIQEINPDIPEGLCFVIDKLLSKSATDRFASCQELALVLEQYLAHLQQPTLIPLPDLVEFELRARSKQRESLERLSVRLPRFPFGEVLLVGTILMLLALVIGIGYQFGLGERSRNDVDNDMAEQKPNEAATVPTNREPPIEPTPRFSASIPYVGGDGDRAVAEWQQTRRDLAQLQLDIDAHSTYPLPVQGPSLDDQILSLDHDIEYLEMRFTSSSGVSP